jgi:D-tyrosyl-tRNA(Tyr) deacylase
MIAVVQRVSKASVTVADPPYVAHIGVGLCVLLGIEDGDAPADASWMANKLAKLRIFKDAQDKMNNSLIDTGGELMLISQFTLAGDCSHGNRPSFIRAASPKIAEVLVTEVGDLLQQDHSIRVTLGKFGAMMQIEIVNDGPVTVVIRRE